MEADALPPSSSKKFAKSEAMKSRLSNAKKIQIPIVCVLVCERFARGYATLCDSRRAVVPVRPVLKLESLRQRTVLHGVAIRFSQDHANGR